MAENEIVYVKSKQPGLKARHFGNPNYEIIFNDEPVAVLKCVADHLIQNPNFEIVINEETNTEDKTEETEEINDNIVKKSQKKTKSSKKGGD